MKKPSEDLEVQGDYDASNGRLAIHAAFPGERVVIYTPTWIVMGTVVSAGTMIIELTDASFAYAAGNHQMRKPGDKVWPGLRSEEWPGSVMRVPAVGVIVVVLT